MALQASWSPGIAFMPAEFPGTLEQVNGVAWTDILGLRQNGGTTFRGGAGAGNWFHVPISTPVIIHDTRAKLLRVFVMFQCGDPNAQIADDAGANLTVVDVWDGPNRIARFGGFKLFGEHRFSLDTNNVFKLPAPLEVIWGIELAVHITFTQDQSVTFAAAGADFES